MMRKISTETGWTALFYLSLVAIVVAGWFAFARPAGAAEARTVRSDELAKVGASTKASDLRRGLAEQAVANRLWDSPINRLASTTLQKLTSMADRNHVQVGGFRTEKPVSVGKLQEASFVAVVEGSFSDIHKFVQAIEDPDSKLVLNLLQIATSESKPGNVTATLGLIAFVKEGP